MKTLDKYTAAAKKMFGDVTTDRNIELEILFDVLSDYNAEPQKACMIGIFFENWAKKKDDISAAYLANEIGVIAARNKGYQAEAEFEQSIKKIGGWCA